MTNGRNFVSLSYIHTTNDDSGRTYALWYSHVAVLVQDLCCVIPSHRFQWSPTSDEYYGNVAHGGGAGWRGGEGVVFARHGFSASVPAIIFRVLLSCSWGGVTHVSKKVQQSLLFHAACLLFEVH